MTALKFSQAWVDQVSSEELNDITVSGTSLAQMPSIEDLHAIMLDAIGANTLREIFRRKWVSASTGLSNSLERIKAVHEYLLSHSGTTTEAIALFRRQQREKSMEEEMATLAWLCRVTDRAKTILDGELGSTPIDQINIKHLVLLSTDDLGPRKAVCYLQEFGIRVITESSLPNMRTDGASFVIPDVGPVIALTLRHDRLDNFWFTLLHELGHVLLHLNANPTDIFVDCLEDGEAFYFLESEVEAEANAFAKDAFIPRDVWLRSAACRTGKESAILELANSYNIHHSIVAGRFRYERKNYKVHYHLLGSEIVRDMLLSDTLICTHQ